MIGTQIAHNPNKPQPVKQRIRYHTGVSVCIAAACQDGGEPRIVLCSDTRLDYGDVGSTNLAVKLDVLGYGWCAQLAGEWSGVRRFFSILKKKVQRLSKVRAVDLEKQARRSANEFLRSPLYEMDKEYQVLLSGFEDKFPSILEVSIYQGNPKVELKDSFGTIGWGSRIAATLLTLRECHSTMPLPYVAYLVYEAKRASEKTGYVGLLTALGIQAPGLPEIKDKAYLKVMNQTGKANLQAIYSGLWRVPFAKIANLEDDFFIDLTAKQSPE